jgi:hypothetical protein
VEWMKDPNSPMRRFLIAAGIYLGTFLAGGIITFAYSYHPLHNAKNWKIEYLEARMVAKSARLDSAAEKLAVLEREALGRPDFEVFEGVQDQLTKAEKSVTSLEKKVSWSDKKIRELEQSRASWKRRASQAESKAKDLAKAAEAAKATARRERVATVDSPLQPPSSVNAPPVFGSDTGSSASQITPATASTPASPAPTASPESSAAD